MINVHCFTFNPIGENTYVLSDETGECVIIDPGCFGANEQMELKAYIETNGLKPVHLLNTHCHLDHVFGNAYVARTWNLDLEMHEKDLPVLRSYEQVCKMYGFEGAEPQPENIRYFDEGQQVQFGNSTLAIFFAPGHAPGHVVFYSAADGFVIGGDVLFQRSIGRTDLPGGDFDTLIRSIREKLFVLPDATIVYSGHGAETTIGEEKKYNPFLQ